MSMSLAIIHAYTQSFGNAFYWLMQIAQYSRELSKNVIENGYIYRLCFRTHKGPNLGFQKRQQIDCPRKGRKHKVTWSVYAPSPFPLLFENEHSHLRFQNMLLWSWRNSSSICIHISRIAHLGQQSIWTMYKHPHGLCITCNYLHLSHIILALY